MSIDREYLCTVAVGNKIYAIGGRTKNNTTVTASVEVYTVASTITAPALTAIAGDSQVNLSWTNVDSAANYNVYRSTTAGGTYTKIATGVTGTTYNDTSVTNGTTYYYVVTAVDSSGTESANSNEASATPKADQKLKVVLEVGEKLQLSVDDDLSANTNMVWTSSDEKVGTVDANGVVSALALGDTVVTAASKDGSYKESINVLVGLSAGSGFEGRGDLQTDGGRL